MRDTRKDADAAWNHLWHFMKYDKPEPDTIITFEFKREIYTGRVSEKGKVEIGITRPHSFSRFYLQPEKVMPLHKIRWWAYEKSITEMCVLLERFSLDYMATQKRITEQCESFLEKMNKQKEEQQ